MVHSGCLHSCEKHMELRVVLFAGKMIMLYFLKKKENAINGVVFSDVGRLGD